MGHDLTRWARMGHGLTRWGWEYILQLKVQCIIGFSGVYGNICAYLGSQACLGVPERAWACLFGMYWACL